MGYSCRTENVMLCLSALDQALAEQGAKVHVGEAQGAAHAAYASLHASIAQQKKERAKVARAA
jgi:alanine-glyoxylate transaminase/serine-glyoxylate transaminase/serine-pyruvate transaminase